MNQKIFQPPTILAEFLSPKSHQIACGKLGKKIQKIVQKSIDISIFRRYNRGSFWIKKLYKSQK